MLLSFGLQCFTLLANPTVQRNLYYFCHVHLPVSLFLPVILSYNGYKPKKPKHCQICHFASILEYSIYNIVGF